MFLEVFTGHFTSDKKFTVLRIFSSALIFQQGLCVQSWAVLSLFPKASLMERIGILFTK